MIAIIVLSTLVVELKIKLKAQSGQLFALGIASA